MIEKIAHMPKYEQIKKKLLKRIFNGEWNVGDKLPVRTELVKEFNSNIVTVNRALSDLISDNVLTATRRAGTFLAASPSNLKKIAILTWSASVLQHSHLFNDRHAFFGMYGTLLNSLKDRRCELVDFEKVFRNPETLRTFDVVFVQPTSERELMRLVDIVDKERIVLLNRRYDGFKSVSVDHHAATFEITEMYLSNLPNARFYFVGTENNLVVGERERGFVDACAEHNKFYRLLKFVKCDDESSFIENVEQIEMSENGPVVVVSSSRDATPIIMRHAAESGMRYNENFFYSDFDNVNPMAMVGYSVTSVLEDYAAVAELAVKWLDDDFTNEKITAPYKIINEPF